ncbi:hypothetical protein BDY21DRAFT_359431 [Lineolata rhizophorae]|uniref:Uncharacterized protein n=1 Tax=Lineolata rhizophorae TaxID=578093 RepID=A0A6A6NL26_9PEZI|nr:hypothetical protein BDY21DRAFT_359431 [Lineolata rhizophorae]
MRCRPGMVSLWRPALWIYRVRQRYPRACASAGASLHHQASSKLGIRQEAVHGHDGLSPLLGCASFSIVSRRVLLTHRFFPLQCVYTSAPTLAPPRSLAGGISQPFLSLRALSHDVKHIPSLSAVIHHSVRISLAPYSLISPLCMPSPNFRYMTAPSEPFPPCPSSTSCSTTATTPPTSTILATSCPAA